MISEIKKGIFIYQVANILLLSEETERFLFNIVNEDVTDKMNIII